MPRQRNRGTKRKTPPEEVPSSQTLEVISFVRRGDTVSKKRTIEKVDFDPMASPIIFPNDDVLPAPGLQAGPSVSAGGAPEEPSSEAASCSVSVALPFTHHIIAHSCSFQTKVQEWISRRPEFLYELLRLEAPSPQDTACSTRKSPAEYQCLNCFPSEVVCGGCLLSRHSSTPLHSIQVCSTGRPLHITTANVPQKWNGHHFEQSTLTSVGLVVQLGHRAHDTCPHPSKLHNLMVFDLSGAHRLVVHYCNCHGHPPKHIQLLRVRWFPATIERPSTTFAFDILDFFHKLQNQSKCNPYDFYNAIIQRTNAAGLNPEIVSSFLSGFLPFLLTGPPVPLQRAYVRLPSLGPPSHPQARRYYI